MRRCGSGSIAKLRAGLDAAAGEAAARCGHLSRRGQRAGDRNRPRVGGQSESRPDQRGPSSQSHGIQQRDSRPVRARPRREAAAARGRDGGRQLRQLRGRPLDFDGPPGAIHVGGPSGHAARDGSASHEPGARDIRDSAARGAGRPAERRSAVRISRRHRDSLRLSRRRRVPRSKSVSDGSIRTTSRAWAGRSSSTSASMASC